MRLKPRGQRAWIRRQAATTHQEEALEMGARVRERLAHDAELETHWVRIIWSEPRTFARGTRALIQSQGVEGTRETRLRVLQTHCDSTPTLRSPRRMSATACTGLSSGEGETPLRSSRSSSCRRGMR